MRRWFEIRSIKQKLLILFMLVATVALSTACLTFWVYELIAYRGALTREMATMVRMLADSSAAAITFNDVRAAKETMAVLRADPRVETGCLQKLDGHVMAMYARDRGTPRCDDASSNEAFQFTLTHLLVAWPVMLEEERIGSVHLTVSLLEMYERLMRFGGIGIAVLVLASMIALALSSRLQRLISGPILHLTEVASRVSAGGNYCLRAEKLSSDESGVLIERFNEMMEQIHNRDLALQTAQDELEDRVDARTCELQKEIAERKSIERDLRKATLAAEQSNRAKSAFLANMSHELRTPLNAIIGYSEMLEEDARETSCPAAIGDLQRIQSAGRHLLALINDVLDLSKIEAGRMEVHMEHVLVSDLVEQAVATTEPLARTNGNRFLVLAGNFQRLVRVDVVKFRQSLMNLLSNACKFTEKGQITLSVEQRTENGKAWMCWKVADTGIGIAPHNIEKLFRSFSQVDSSATRIHGGTGLGLALSQRYCQMMGGHITVESREAEGSAFTIYLPYDEVLNSVEAAEAACLGPGRVGAR